MEDNKHVIMRDWKATPCQVYNGEYVDATGQSLDETMARQDRKLEVQFFRNMKVYDKVPTWMGARDSCNLITTRWLDINKGDPHNPNSGARLVAMRSRHLALFTLNFAGARRKERVVERECRLRCGVSNRNVSDREACKLRRRTYGGSARNVDATVSEAPKRETILAGVGHGLAEVKEASAAAVRSMDSLVLEKNMRSIESRKKHIDDKPTLENFSTTSKFQFT